MEIVILVLVFYFGSIVGSFLNVVILRLPEEQSLDGRSHCPSCHHLLGPLDLFPLFSFVFLFGKCRYCGQKISPRYFTIELATGLLFVWSWLYFQPQSWAGLAPFVLYCFSAAVLVVVFVVDLEHYIILDKVIFPAMAVVSILNLVNDLSHHRTLWSSHSALVSGLVGGAVLSATFFLIWYFSKGLWLGFGDVKLAIFLGLVLGWPVVWVGLMLAVFLGGLVSIGLLLFTSRTLKSQIPFGTFLSVGTILALFYGQKLLAWYLGILGF